MPRVAAVRSQMEATLPTSGVDLRLGVSPWRWLTAAGIESELPAVGGDGEGIVVARIDLLRPQPLVAGDQLLLDAACSSDIGQATIVGLPPSSGVGEG